MPVRHWRMCIHIQSDTYPIQPILASNNLFFARYLTFNIKNYILSEIIATFAAA